MDLLDLCVILPVSVHIPTYADRRIGGLKKRIQELWSELELANAELEDTKRLKEKAEQEVKGYEVELAMNEASIQTLEVSFFMIRMADCSFKLLIRFVDKILGFICFFTILLSYN